MSLGKVSGDRHCISWERSLVVSGRVGEAFLSSSSRIHSRDLVFERINSIVAGRVHLGPYLLNAASVPWTETLGEDVIGAFGEALSNLFDEHIPYFSVGSDLVGVDKL